ncbi:MAG: zinc-ribbon domain containing protein [Betaproteobacteria bacterium]|nr:zinc-ribbon domain containing protein [Betaproteobacteria bacterium]
MYTDRELTCRDCGQTFVFTAGEQEFFATRGFQNDPSRCPSCRAARNSGGGAYSGGGHSGGYDRGERQMFPAVCSDCGKDTLVPFPSSIVQRARNPAALAGKRPGRAPARTDSPATG